MQLIKNWIELSKVPDSETHRLNITPEYGSGWIVSKKTGKDIAYLSTHTFYNKMQSEFWTKKLQKYGFDAVLDIWDKEKNK